MKDAYTHMAYNSAILSILKEFHEQKKYWDVRVRVSWKVFKCQRAILAANSEYFDDTFSSDNSQGSNATAHQTITLPDDMDAKAFKRILRFMYTGEIRAEDYDFLHLLVLSDFLRLRTDHFKERMVELVSERSKDRLPMWGAIDLLRYACNMGEKIFVDIMCAHVCRHLYHFSMYEQLMEITFEHLNALLERSKNYIVPLPGSSDVLVKIVHNWVNHSREVRSQYRLQLMKNVDFTKVSSDLTLSLMNKLENVVDDVSKISSDVRSYLELESSLGAALEVFPFDGPFTSGPQGTILWNVSRISELAIGEELSSPSSMISNVLWKISLERSTSDKLDFYLCCEGSDSASVWNINAEAIFSIWSYKDGKLEDVFHYLRPRLFSSSASVPRGWVLRSFLRWNELVDPENGYIAENDDCIVLGAKVFAGVPFLSYNPQ